MNTLAILVFLCVGAAYGSDWCYYSDGTERLCDACCEYDCCERRYSTPMAVGLSVGAGALIFALILTCVCCRRRRSQGVIVTTMAAPQLTVTQTHNVNPYHAGYNQPPPPYAATFPSPPPQQQQQQQQQQPKQQQV